MRYLLFLLYFLIATTMFYFVSKYVANQESGSFEMILGNVIRGLIIVATGYLVAIKMFRNERNQA
ncbi:hypothetical protein CHH72_18575 [Shouchella clausii]|uniref:Uncharacterized protein n=1 Tax=Shouchella clausii TaxID=79880 RepID=A0A268NVC8_SHOCL|nr:hypothetical protein CHH72_18575 [Shouchella clausii]